MALKMSDNGSMVILGIAIRRRHNGPMLSRLAGGDIDLSIEPLFPVSQEPRRHECAQVRKDIELGDLVVNHQIPEYQGHDVPRSDFAALPAVDSRLALLVGRSDEVVEN